MKSYKIIRNDRGGVRGTIPIGTTVYYYSGYDYGLCRDDFRAFGIEHTKITLNENGDGPFYTIPVIDLKEIKE